MSQHDFNIANQGFPATRADINNAFQAIASNSSGATAPATTYANMWWYDTANNKMYLRNEADSAWIEVATIDQTNNEWLITTGRAQAVDGDGLVLKTDEGTARITIADTGNVTIANDLTVNGNLDVSSGTIKLDGNYPTGTDNVALGNQALDDGSLTGNYNTSVGSNSMTATTSGQQNTAIGRRSLFSNTTGSYNSALGLHALYTNTTGSNNVAIGMDALSLNTTASQNTAVGYQAGYNTTTPNNNAFFGQWSGYNNTTGAGNTYIGQGAGYNMTTGSENTIIGAYNGNQGGLDIRTSSNNIVLSDGDGNPRIIHDGDDVWLDTSYRSFSGDDKDVALFKRFNVGNLASGGTPVNENEINRGFAYITGEVGSDNTFRTVIDNISGAQTGWIAHGCIGASDKTQDAFAFMFARRGLSGGIEFLGNGSTIVQMNWTGSVYQLQMKSSSSTYGQGFYLMVRAL